jgi:hypothetical protein
LRTDATNLFYSKHVKDVETFRCAQQHDRQSVPAHKTRIFNRKRIPAAVTRRAIKTISSSLWGVAWGCPESCMTLHDTEARPNLHFLSFPALSSDL